jgi:hypothetical protein
MKKILLALSVLVLSGCTVVDAYLMTKYDPNEYILITEIRADAVIAKATCANAQQSAVMSNKISNETALFMQYSEYIPRNDNGYSASKSLNEIAQGLSAKYNKGETVSPAFCKLKFEGIEHSASLIQKVIGARPR